MENVPIKAAMYVGPNPDGTRKRCWNCVHWVDTQGGKCRILPESQLVRSDAICGYHVYGYPQMDWSAPPGIEPVPPKLAGLEVVPGGTSCDTCRYYKPGATAGRGRCEVVVDGGKEAAVEALGCCALWQRGETAVAADRRAEAARRLKGL